MRKTTSYAQDAFNIVYNALKEAGVPLDELNKKLAQEFPSAAQATKSSVDCSVGRPETG